MPLLVLLTALILLSFSCNTKEGLGNLKEDHSLEEEFDPWKIDRNLRIQINYALSYKIDLTEEKYTVFLVGNPDFKQVAVKFSLLATEREAIIMKYYALSLHELIPHYDSTGDHSIEDECMVMPKLYTQLTIISDNKTQKIKVDEDCEDYSTAERSRLAKRIKAFNQFVYDIVKVKPSVKKAPLSDIMYL